MPVTRWAVCVPGIPGDPFDGTGRRDRRFPTATGPRLGTQGDFFGELIVMDDQPLESGFLRVLRGWSVVSQARERGRQEIYLGASRLSARASSSQVKRDPPCTGAPWARVRGSSHPPGTQGFT